MSLLIETSTKLFSNTQQADIFNVLPKHKKPTHTIKDNKKQLTTDILKIYPTHLKLIKYNKPQLNDTPPHNPHLVNTSQQSEEQKQLNLTRSLRRSKSKIKDYVLCNNFQYFITLTFAENRQDNDLIKQNLKKYLRKESKKYNRYIQKQLNTLTTYVLNLSVEKNNKPISIEENLRCISITSYLPRTLVSSNQSDSTRQAITDPLKSSPISAAVNNCAETRLPHLARCFPHLFVRYVLVPEFHKDKRSLHIHALIGGVPSKFLTPSCKNTPKGKLFCTRRHKHHSVYINRRLAYNIINYDLGYNSAIKIDNSPKVASYVTKYITKDMPQFKDKKRYWISTSLLEPITVVNPQISTTYTPKWRLNYINEQLQIYNHRHMFKILTKQDLRDLWLHQIKQPTSLIQASLLN